VLLKDFKKLVAYCRSVGVLSYSGEVSFTLSPNDPKEDKRTIRKLQKVEDAVEQRLAELGDEDLLLYSASSLNEKDA
jgi:hypothetical protein